MTVEHHSTLFTSAMLNLIYFIPALHETSQDKTLKCSVFRIKGPVPANSYILVPKNTNHSLGLTGHYFYLLFRPIPGKYFVVHLDVATEVSCMILINLHVLWNQ